MYVLGRVSRAVMKHCGKKKNLWKKGFISSYNSDLSPPLRQETQAKTWR